MPTTLLIASPRIFQTLLRPTLFGTLPPSKTMTTKMSRLVSLLVVRVGFILLTLLLPFCRQREVARSLISLYFLLFVLLQSYLGHSTPPIQEDDNKNESIDVTLAGKAPKAWTLPRFWISIRSTGQKKIWGRILGLAWLKFVVAPLITVGFEFPCNELITCFHKFCIYEFRFFFQKIW